MNARSKLRMQRGLVPVLLYILLALQVQTKSGKRRNGLETGAQTNVQVEGPKGSVQAPNQRVQRETWRDIHRET